MFSVKKYKNKKVCVLGMGKSGVACAHLLRAKGFKVLLSENSAQPVAEGLKGVEVETGGHTDKVLACGFVVKSPGIEPHTPILKKIKELKIPIFSEIEIARAFAPKDCKIFAVSGTNGKTTTTVMLSEIMKAHCTLERKGRKVYTVGNIGQPFSSVAAKVKSGGIVVMEVSSYQLEDSSYFKPFCGCILNITPDHLEHHGSLQKYIAAKEKIFTDQTSRDYFVTNGSDKHCVKMLKSCRAAKVCFSSKARHIVQVAAFFDGDEMIFANGAHIKPPKLLMGIHNIENAMCASLMAFAYGVSPKAVQKGFDTFNCLEHRIEYFAEHKGIKCYNDSKATNVDSTITALKALGGNKNIWVILGGRGKGAPYKPLLGYLNKFCKHAVLIGEDAPNIKNQLSGSFPMTEKGTLEKAARFIFKQAAKGDVMLLSPACASFDQFKDFEDRGVKFKALVQRLIKQQA